MKSTLDPIHWKSHAWWPEECCPTIGNYSDDTHATKEEAVGVCNLLHRNGFGGAGKFFPIRTEVVPIYATPDPTNVSELAREVVKIVNNGTFKVAIRIRVEKAIQSALSKLAAEKDADFNRVMDRESALLNERLKLRADIARHVAERQTIVNRLAKALDDKIGVEEDLARHVAALKVARDALEEYRKPEHWILESAEWRWIPDPHLSFVNPHDVSEDALQRIDKELL